MAVAKRRQREDRECDWASKFWHLEGWRFNSSGKQHKSNRYGKKWFVSAGAKSTIYFTLWLFSQLGRACCFLPRQVWQALYVYLLEYQSGKRVSHKRVLELSYEDVKSAKMDWLSLHRILIILLQNLLRQTNIQNIWQKRQFWKGLQTENITVDRQRL